MAENLKMEQERFCVAAWPTLVGALTHYCGDVHLAEELVQEALLRACQRWTAVSRMAAPEAWVYRVAVNLCRSTFRRRRAEQRARRRHGPSESQQSEPHVVDQVAVRGALAALTGPQREAVIMRFFLDLSTEQAAELMQTTPGAVRALTHRATAQLRQALDVSLPEQSEVPDAT